MQKWWSFLFGGVMLAATLSVIASPFVGWGLPKNVSSYGGQVDFLFHFILIITGFFFILTEAILVYFMYTYAAEPGRQEHVVGHHYSEKSVFWVQFFKKIAKPVTTVIHNQHRLELAWSIIPGIILVIISIVQIRAWADIKYQSRMPNPGEQPLNVEVSARQFEWRMRYPSPGRLAEWAAKPELAKDFAFNPHEDDIHVVNEVHAWKGHKVLVHLKTRDVIHSFYLPNMRLKQDALPGKTIPVWFQATDFNTRETESGKWVDGYDPQTKENGKSEQIWELNCAELCGWGHYKMQGRLYVHETKEDFLKWLKDAQSKQNARTIAH